MTHDDLLAGASEFCAIRRRCVPHLNHPPLQLYGTAVANGVRSITRIIIHHPCRRRPGHTSDNLPQLTLLVIYIMEICRALGLAIIVCRAWAVASLNSVSNHLAPGAHISCKSAPSCLDQHLLEPMANGPSWSTQSSLLSRSSREYVPSAVDAGESLMGPSAPLGRRGATFSLRPPSGRRRCCATR